MGKITHAPLVVQVYELSEQGRRNHEIADLLAIKRQDVSDIKRTTAYKELVKNAADEQAEQDVLFVNKQVESLQQLAIDAQKRLSDLIYSENDKVALDAAKFILDHLARLQDKRLDSRLVELETIVMNITQNNYAGNEKESGEVAPYIDTVAE